MAITLVQSNTNTANGVSTFTVAYTSNNTAGNFLAIMTREPTGSGNTYLVTDTNSNLWNRVLKFSNSGEQYELFYVMNCAGGANTVSVTLQGGGTFNYRAVIVEFSGLRITSVLDSSASAITTTLPDIGTPFITANFSTELLLGFFANQTSDTVSPISDSSWTAIANVTGNLAAFYKLVPVVTPPTSWSLTEVSPVSAQYCGSITALQVPSAGVVPGFLRQYTAVGGASQSTIALSSVTLTVGSVVILSLSWGESSGAVAVSGIADTLGNTWTAVSNTLSRNTNNSPNIVQQHWISAITTGGTSTVTATLAANVAFPILIGAAFNNINTSTPVQTANQQTGNGSPVSPTISPTGNLALFGSLFVGGNNGTTPTPPWLLLGNSSTFPGLPTAYQLIIAGQYNFVGETSSSVTAGAGIASFISNTVTSGNFSSAFRDFASKRNSDDDYRKSR